MEQTLLITITSFVVLFSALLMMRFRQLRMEDELAALREEIA